VSRTLFAERFAVAPIEEADSSPAPRYDELRGYNVGLDGRPYVELEVFGATVTVTRANAEPDDDDREWVRAFGSRDTVTKAQTDTDRWSF
jgi:hypothetical protein